MAHVLLGEARSAGAAIRSNGSIPILDETFHYIVQADSKTATRQSILVTPGLPIVNQTVSASGFTRCRSKSANRREDQPLIWDVTADFSSEIQENQSGVDNSYGTLNPVSWVPIYETKFERLQEVVTKDKAGTSVANSAGQPFQTGLTVGRFIPIWEFYQFEPATVTDEQIIERNETTNSASFKGRAAQTLLLTVLSSVIGFYYGSRVRLTHYSLKYNKRFWTHKRLDVGTVYKSGSNHEPYLDNAGNVMLGPLNGSGGKQTVGTAPAVLEWYLYDELDFNAFLRI